MKRLFPAIAASLALGSACGTPANASDLTEGEQLYVAQCQICHGKVKQDTGLGTPVSPPQGIRLAMLDAVQSGTTDFGAHLIPAFGTTGEHIAFAPPFGPHLRGVVGRPAGSVEGYDYSKTMMTTLKGMIWTEEALDVWITNPQAWVPGVYMFYKQKDPEVRRKIILYLKANS